MTISTLRFARSSPRMIVERAHHALATVLGERRQIARDRPEHRTSLVACGVHRHVEVADDSPVVVGDDDGRRELVTQGYCHSHRDFPKAVTFWPADLV